MNQHLHRWARIVFYSREDLRRLHEAENALSRQKKCWQAAESQLFEEMMAKYRLHPYWPKGLTTDVQKNRLDDFMRRIYPVWKPMYDRWLTTIDNEDVEDELSLLHRLDAAVLACGQRPDRLAPVDVEKLRKMDQGREIFEKVME